MVEIGSGLAGPLAVFAGKHKEIVAVYLFGSAATGKNRTDSDIDLAVMTNQRISGEERIEWETELANQLGGKDVDLVIFNQAGVLLRHQILKYGKLVHETDFHDRVRQEVAARRDYLETRFLYRKLAA